MEAVMATASGGDVSLELWTAAVALKLIALTLLYRRWMRRDPATSASESSPEVDVDEERLLAWEPLPLVPGIAAPLDVPVDVRLKLKAAGHPATDLGATDFLRLPCEEAAVRALRRYGVGACGPLTFYGTFDEHIELERRLARFTSKDDAIVFSYGFATAATTIPALLKRDGLAFVDEAIAFAAQRGLDASRVEVVRYRHNDLDHLARLLRERAPDRRGRGQRPFIVAEGISLNTGELCPLDRLVALRREHGARLLLDDGLAFGALGRTGRGTIEHFGVDAHEVDIVVGSLEHALNSSGGFCAGFGEALELLRLRAAGYTFSASLPPLLAQAALTSLDFIEREPSRIQTLRENSIKLQSALSTLPHFRLGGHRLSPIKHLYLNGDDASWGVERQERVLKAIARHCLENGTALVVAAYIREAEYRCPEPSIRVASNALLDDAHIDRLTELLLEGYEKCKHIS